MPSKPSLVRSRLPRWAVPAVLALHVSVLVPAAHCFVEISRGELLAEVKASVGIDSNIYGNASEMDDTLITIEPAAVYSRRAGRLNVDARAGVSVNDYADFDAEDSTDQFARIDMTLPTVQGSPLTGNLYADYFNGRRIDIYLTDRIEIDALSFGGRGAYRFNPKTEVRFGGDYLTNSPEGFQGSDTWSVLAGAGYVLRPKATAFLDYRYRRTTSDRNPITLNKVGRRDDGIFAGVGGELSALLSGVVSVGFQTSDTDSSDIGGDADKFIADVSLNWTPRQRTEVTLSLSADSAVTNDAQTVDRKAVTIGLEQEIGRSFSFKGTVGWEKFDFRQMASRSDDQLTASARLAYEARKFLTAGVEVTYWNRDPQGFVGFDRTTLTFYTTFRY